MCSWKVSKTEFTPPTFRVSFDTKVNSGFAKEYLSEGSSFWVLQGINGDTVCGNITSVRGELPDPLKLHRRRIPMFTQLVVDRILEPDHVVSATENDPDGTFS